MKLVVALLALAAGLAQAQGAGRFSFASVEQARGVLGARDDYVRATAAFERSVVLRTRRAVAADEFAAAMRDTALAWSAEDQRALAGVLPRLERFLAAMRWKAPAAILIVKTRDRLMDGFPHTRGNAIVLPESMWRDALARPAMLDYLLAHETFHVLSRADPGLREELYRAIGFRACAAVELPEPLSRLRLTNPDAPENRHTVAARRGGRPLEAMPFVHFPSEAIDPQAGFGRQMRAAWLVVERREDRCSVRDERVAPEELEGLYEQTGRNTAYMIHPEEILADNFALLFSAPPQVPSPEILERLRRILH
jgi:hypothetical protein